MEDQQQSEETPGTREKQTSILPVMLMTDVEFGAEPKQYTSVNPLKNLTEALKHPLFLLIVGALITSLLIPYLNDQFNRTRVRQETSLRKVLEIGLHNTEFNSELNTLKTMMQSFHSQNVRLQLQPDELKEAQRNFRDDFNARYLALDEKAWYWYWDLGREAEVLNLISPNKLQMLDADLNKYGANVTKSIEAMRPLWRALTSHDYNPNDKEYREKFDKMLNEVNVELSPLFETRKALVESISKHFAPNR
jgi:hypothetical protein